MRPPWDLAWVQVTGRQGTAARSRLKEAVGTGDARDRPLCGVPDDTLPRLDGVHDVLGVTDPIGGMGGTGSSGSRSAPNASPGTAGATGGTAATPR